MLGRRRESSLSALAPEFERACPAPNPSARLLAEERLQRLQRAVDALPPRERLVLETLLAEEMDFERATARLGCERKALKFRVWRTRQRLRAN